MGGFKIMPHPPGKCSADTHGFDYGKRPLSPVMCINVHASVAPSNVCDTVKVERVRWRYDQNQLNSEKTFANRYVLKCY